ncbi:hypothetical protein [Pseudoflavonifractor phocaeensis]|uniref:hypothetical protein n=1 Tax=Pseudoflavonifractor phocaeensis TaxID=1870988 RepID=UPI00210BFF58|nr:hypothetical protein [Pseudoflavonifractor phocaeensis]MCQ4865646.1 hypothetical protein [Pseudoflavonifractor phocaeensis]
MKIRTSSARRIFVFVYLTLCVSGAGFYILSDFGKALTKLAGIVWLMAAIASWLSYISGKKAAVQISVIIMTFLQIPIIWNRFYWSGGGFYFLSLPLKIGAWGALPHTLLLMQGILAAGYVKG